MTRCPDGAVTGCSGRVAPVTHVDSSADASTQEEQGLKTKPNRDTPLNCSCYSYHARDSWDGAPELDPISPQAMHNASLPQLLPAPPRERCLHRIGMQLVHSTRQRYLNKLAEFLRRPERSPSNWFMVPQSITGAMIHARLDDSIALAHCV